MTIKRPHNLSDAKRRGEVLPARLRIDARRGVSLVELMISMLILVFVTVTWMKLIGAQSARRESARREAVERLSGLMDAFMYDQRTLINVEAGRYSAVYADNAATLTFVKQEDEYYVSSMFDSDRDKYCTTSNKLVFARENYEYSSIGYQLLVIDLEDEKSKTVNIEVDLERIRYFRSLCLWDCSSEPVYWLVGRLFDRCDCREGEEDSGKPFFSVAVCLGEPIS